MCSGPIVLTKLMFTAGLLAGALLIARWTPRRKYFWVRLAFWVAVFIGETFAYSPIVGLIRKATGASAPFWLQFLVQYIMAMFMIFGCYKTDFWGAMFCATAGYCLQHLTHRLTFLFAFYMPDVWAKISLVAVTGIAYFLLYYFFIRKCKYLLSEIAVNNKLQVFVSVFSCVLIIALNSEVLGYIRGRTGQMLVECMSMCAALVILVLQFTMIYAKRSDDEVTRLTAMLNEKRVMLDSERQSMEQMNVRAHDLRHYLRHMDGKLDRNVIKELKGVIDEYDGFMRTGNESLDVILKHSYTQCKANGIKFTGMLDGEKLAFIQPHELYALFGNAIENAVAAVKSLPEEKRVISVTQIVRDKLIVIMFVNYFDGELTFDGELPTTKQDGRYHGFGVRSIQLIAQKYGGDISVKTSADMFTLEVLLPLGE